MSDDYRYTTRPHLPTGQGPAGANTTEPYSCDRVGNRLHYYRARYYEPQDGRFISEDPIQFKGGDLNFYRYSSNSPVALTDPLGLKTVCMVVGVGKLGTRTVVCWDDDKGSSEMITGRVLPMPKKPTDSDIATAYDSFQECKRRQPAHPGVVSQVCKPETTMNPEFSDDFGINADPKYEISATSTEFQGARNCLERFPLAALDSRFNPKETLDPHSIVEAVTGMFYNLHPW